MLERWLEIPQDKSCLIIGPRRSGKTSLLTKRYPEHRYATLDDLDHLDWAKRDPNTKKYLNALQQAQMTFKLSGYQYGPAKRHIKAAKTYFADNGIIHSLNAGVSLPVAALYRGN